ncbi:MAG: alginate export family protein [Planctomycetes bacterium]|nr:alginate export family protein [Planctomycetota bacterium]
MQHLSQDPLRSAGVPVIRLQRSSHAVWLSVAFCVALSSAGLRTQDRPATEGGETSHALEFELPNSKKIKVSGELRWRAESRQNYDFKNDAGTDPFFVGQRARIALDFDVNDDVRAFLQVADTRQFGEETSTTDRSADGFDMHQAFLEWKAHEDLLLKIGRQEVALGEQRLVSSLNWLDQARALDGVVGVYDTGEQSTLTGFATIINNDALQTDNRGAWINGAYWNCKQENGLDTDLYAILLLNEETIANGTEHRWTFGGRARQTFDSGFFVGAEAATQVGEVDGRDIPFIKTYGVHADAGIQLDDDLKPRFMVEADIASGNKPGTNDNERFNSLIPFAHAYWGQMDFALWENMLHFAVHAEIQPAAKSKLKVAWHMFQSMEPTDRFGGPVLTLSPGVVGGSDKMGNEIDITYRHDLGSGLWGEAGASMFLAGSGSRDARTVGSVRGDDDPALFFYYMMGIKL